MYKLKDVYKTFPSGATEDYKILRAFEMGKQEGGAKVKELEAQINRAFEVIAFKRKRIAELEKENAERNAEIENDRDLPAIAYMQGAEKQKRKDEEQLTKAKDLLLKLSTCLEGHSNNNFEYELIKEAEQFLKESEGK